MLAGLCYTQDSTCILPYTSLSLGNMTQIKQERSGARSMSAHSTVLIISVWPLVRHLLEVNWQQALLCFC